MKYSSKVISIMLVGIMSLALFACKGKTNDVRINFNDGAYAVVTDEEVSDNSNIECSYTDSLEDVNEELKEVYNKLVETANGNGKTIEFNYEYLDVQGAYIYKVKFKDDKEHGLLYHNDYYKEYSKYNNCYTCIIRVEEGKEPTYNTYDISENTYFKMKGTAYIFYGRLHNE